MGAESSSTYPSSIRMDSGAGGGAEYGHLHPVLDFFSLPTRNNLNGNCSSFLLVPSRLHYCGLRQHHSGDQREITPIGPSPIFPDSSSVEAARHLEGIFDVRYYSVHSLGRSHATPASRKMITWETLI